MMFLPNERYAGVYSAVLLCGLLSTATATAAEISSLTTGLESEWTVYTRNSDTQKMELLIQPELEINLTDDSRVTSIVRLRSDVQDNLSPGDHSQAELREFYVDASINNSIVRIGKQQVVWGKSDGLKVLDIVNPQDFREFILDDFDQSRIPLWTVNTEIPVYDMTLQLLLIPDQTYHEFANSGGSYAFTSPLIIPSTPPGASVVVNPTITPDRALEDADFGFRLSMFTQGWDLSLNYLYHFDDTPILFRTIDTLLDAVVVTINPEYKRTHLIGGTFTKTYGDLTIRGEIGYLTDKFIATTNSLDVDGVVKTGQLNYVLGFDWYGVTDTLLSAQIFQTRLDGHQTVMIGDRINTQLTLLIKQDYLNETLHAEVILLRDLDNKDGMIRPKITYQYNDEVTVHTGFDFFYGNKRGLFGQFKNTDRFVAGIEIGFN